MNALFNLSIGSAILLLTLVAVSLLTGHLNLTRLLSTIIFFTLLISGLTLRNKDEI